MKTHSRPGKSQQGDHKHFLKKYLIIDALKAAARAHHAEMLELFFPQSLLSIPTFGYLSCRLIISQH